MPGLSITRVVGAKVRDFVRSSLPVYLAATALKGFLGGKASVSVPHILRAYARRRPDAIVIQVGANDGAKNDPLREILISSRWRAILVEASPSVFARLIARQADYGDRVVFENVGIAPTGGKLTFYHLDEIEGDPDWYDQIGTFDRATFLRNVEVVPGLIGRMRMTDIQTSTLPALLARHNLDRIHVLHTDVEGLDADIILSLNLSRVRPDIVLYEAEWLAPDRADELANAFQQAGYTLRASGGDTLAIHRSVLRGRFRCRSTNKS